MLLTLADVTLARFPDFDHLDQAEIAQADAVVLDSFDSRGIYHPVQLNWKGDLAFFPNAEAFVRSDKERKKLAEAKAFFLDQGYTIEVKNVDDSLNHQFMELYRQTTLQKNRAIEYNSEMIVNKNLKSGVPVYLFGLFKDEQLESGLLASQVKDELRVMFGAKKKFPQVRGGIGGVLEIELLEFAYANHFQKISHGLSTNPAGIVDSAGVFEFKTRYGFTPFPVNEWRTMFILKPMVAQSDLVFVTIRDNQLIQLVVTDVSESVTEKYTSRLIPTTVQTSLTEHIAQARQLFGLDPL